MLARFVDRSVGQEEKSPSFRPEKKKGKKEGKKRKDQPSLFQLNTDLESAWLNWNNLSLSLSFFSLTLALLCFDF